MELNACGVGEWGVNAHRGTAVFEREETEGTETVCERSLCCSDFGMGEPWDWWECSKFALQGLTPLTIQMSSLRGGRNDVGGWCAEAHAAAVLVNRRARGRLDGLDAEFAISSVRWARTNP